MSANINDEGGSKAVSHQQRIMDLFVSSRKKSAEDVDQLIDKAMEGDTIALEVAVSEFFKTYRVGIYGRDNIRKSIREDTDGEVDVGDAKVYERLANQFTRNETLGQHSLISAKPIKVEKDDVGSRMGYTVFNTQSEKDKETVMKHFREYFATKHRPVDVDQLIDGAKGGHVAPLERAVVEYFKQKHNIPKQRKSPEVYRNNLKQAILDRSNGKVDIGRAAGFKELQMVYADAPRKIGLKGESKEVIKAVRDRSEKARTRVMNRFREYCLSKSNPLNVDDLLEKAMGGDFAPLETALVDFFSELTVSHDGKSVPPKRMSVLAFKSHIKRQILTHTDGKVDIGSPFTFKKLDDLFAARWHKDPSGGNRWGRNKTVPNGEYSRSTIISRNRMVKHFSDYFASKDPPVEVDFLIEVAKDGDVVPLEKALIEFFQVLCVNVDGKNQAPKRATVECYKSHIKISILEKTGRTVDIGNSVRFRQFHKFYSEYNGAHPPYLKDVMQRKQAELIDPSARGQMHTMLGNLLAVLDTRGTDMYDRNLLKLPANCHHNYHDLLKMAAMYVVVMCDVKRGQESFAAMRKNMYRRKYDANTERQWFERTTGGGGGGNLDVEFCGMIPFHTDKNGFDPGRIMDYYLSKLNPENRFLFQRSFNGKKLDLHESSSDDVPWYDASAPTGKNSIAWTIPTLCKLAGVPVLHNTSIRATGIQMLRGTGFADLIGSGEYVDAALDPSDYQEDDDDDDLDQGEAELMEFEGESEEILETKPDLGSLIGDAFEQESQ